MTDPLNKSYYAATANGWTPQPVLLGEVGCDVCVVGGGFTGVSAALACAEKGLAVVLLEAETVGFGASGRNGGQLIPGLRWSMQEIDEAFGRERAKAIFDLAWGAGARVRDRIARHGIDCDLKPGHLEAALKPAQFDELKREAEFLENQFGWSSIDVIDWAELGQHINGGGYVGAAYDRAGGHFHPLNYALGLAAAAQASGVRFYENSAALRIDEKGVATAQGHVLSREIILATDAWTDRIAPDLGRYTVPIMNYNIATAPLPDSDRLLPSDAAVADCRFVLNYFRLSADKRLIFGGGEKYVQTPPADIGAFVRRHILQVFPALSDTPIDYEWGGAVTVTMNRLPHFGRRGNVSFAHGFSGHGALVTTLAGELLAEAVTGTMGRFDVFANLPHRMFPGGRLLARPLATLGLIWYALRDRL